MRAKLVAAEKKFDADLEKMASAMQAGIADGTYDKPQRNGTLKRCFRGMMNSLAAIVAIVPPALASSLIAKGGLAPLLYSRFNVPLQQIYIHIDPVKNNSM